MAVIIRCLCLCSLTLFSVGGCESASYGQRGTVLGALGGGGIGALIGHATGHTGAGALIGTGVGAVTGAAVGTSLDDIDARNRAKIAAQLGPQVDQGGATTVEVLAMTRAGVDPQLIINYVNRSGMMQPLTVQDVIYLHEQGVDANVIQAMQNPVRSYAPAIARIMPPRQTVIIEDDPWGSYDYPHYHFSYGCGGCGCYH